MRPVFLTTFACLTLLFSQTVNALVYEEAVQDESAQESMQIILAAEMPDIADTSKTRYGELKQLIKDEREQVPTTFFIFGGGSVGPSALSNLDRGSHIIDILNSLEPDAMGVAKREFSYLEDELSLRSYEAAFPMVASNLIDTRFNTLLTGLTDTALITRNKVTLGFISISDPRLVNEYLLDNVIVQDAEKTIRVLSQELREAGADIVLLHFFDAFPTVVKLLDEHVLNYAFNSNTRYLDSIVPEYLKDPRIFTLDSPGSAIIASLAVNRGFELLSVTKSDLTNIPADPVVENQVNSYLHRLNRLLDDNIAYWDGTFSTRRDDVRGKENAFANFVVDTMRSFGKADIAIINGGAIRGDTTYQKNTQITRRTIATELPFRAALTVITVSGQQILDALEAGLAGLDQLRGTFPQVSGMRVEFDSNAPAGNRVQSVYINDEQLNLSKNYVLATTDYLASGGDGYASLAVANTTTVASFKRTILVSDLVQQVLNLNGKLDSKVEQRIVDVGSKP